MEIFKNSNFLILQDGEEYIFYNSIRHYVCRVSKLDLSLFNLIYVLKSYESVCEYVLPKYHKYVQGVYDAVNDYQILSEEPIYTDKKYIQGLPHNYYLHLTYECNLNCIYCYNKQIRNSFDKLPFSKWETILSKILPYAHSIVLTGGEPFLSPILSDIIDKIKEKKKSVKVEIISNCMTNFKRYPNIDSIMNKIDKIIFSCDNLSDINQPRINFSPTLFKKNISFLRDKYKTLNITISSIYTKNNYCELKNIEDFSASLSVDFRKVLVVPNNKEDIDLLPPLSEYTSSLSSEQEALTEPRFYCGAGVGILSIDPMGNAYPCQSLHFKDFKLGNILDDSLADIARGKRAKAIIDRFNVKNISTCKDCNVKHICGAGCRAATLKVEGNASAFPQTLCEYYKANAVHRLHMTPSLGDINLLKCYSK